MLGATDTEATRSVYHEIKGVVSALWIWPVLFEKMISNLVALWSGKFKGLDTRDEDYEIPEEVWEEIWRETVGDIPSSFSRSLVPWAGIHRSAYIIPTCGFVPWMMSLVFKIPCLYTAPLPVYFPRPSCCPRRSPPYATSDCYLPPLHTYPMPRIRALGYVRSQHETPAPLTLPR
ncbi:hypothetical protein B0H13DRAFT_2387087 [Mycena leptocephala]|nr:hypothetical protein B0H13DRAFT_2387087 [Mycena leptocephala]